MARLIIAWLVLFCVSCACWSAAHRDEPACRTVNAIIDCAAKEIAPRIPSFYPLVEYILSGANTHPSWMEMLTVLEGAGVGAVACTVEQVRMDIMTRGTAEPRAYTQAATPPAVAAAEEYLRVRNLRVKLARPVDGGAK